MPDEYKDFEIVGFLLDQTQNEEQYQRVVDELTLYFQYNMIDVLRYCKYLVDTMRNHKIVWGVGRGSSVASYCLYLLGMHKIDSIKFDLDINEFLK
jgi:DNA polymerase III alpha subunit